MVYTRAIGDMAEGNGEVDPVVTLQPFNHQVGGHTPILLFDQTTICKALNAREFNFYRNIPPEIKPFAPTFKGVIQMSMARGNNAPPVRNISPSCSSMPRSRSLDLDPESKNQSAKESLSVKVISEESLRLSRLLDKTDNSWTENPNERHFLLLENIASQFNRPCVLDLKMGTRQHGDDAPEEKRHRHMAKCAASTSAGLGVRLCGMQVYQADLGVYFEKDKYFGRQLDEDGFKQALNEFFHNGFKVRTQVLYQVIERLKRLRKVVEKQNSFRFYSSSLLILYEGCSAEESEHCDDACCDAEMELSSHFWDLRSMGEGRAGHPSDVGGCPCPDAMDDKSNDSLADSCCTDSESVEEAYHSGGKRRNSLVDVRMIDFAHTTYEGYMGDSMVHRGPDNGYLLGLDNLCRLLQDILVESSHDKE